MFIDLLKKENRITLLLLSVLTFSSIVSTLVQSLRIFLVIPFKLDTLFLYTIYSFIWFLSFKKISNRFINNKYALLFILFFISYVLLTMIFNLQYFDFIISIFLKSIISFSWLIIGISISNFSAFKKVLYLAAFINLISSIFNIFIFENFSGGGIEYSQELGYLLLFPSIVFLDSLMNKISFSNLFFLAISIFLMLFVGARGPFGGLIFYFLFNTLITQKFFFKFLFLLASFLTLFFLFIVFVDFFESIAIYFNLSTRLISFIREFNILYFFDRFIILRSAINILSRNILFGVGIYIDRILIAEDLGVFSIEASFGYYPHNIFFEFILQFGLIIGLFLILLFIFIINKVLHLEFYKNIKNIFWIVFSLSVVPLLYSGSYTESNFFFFLIGLIFNFINAKSSHGNNYVF